MYLTNLHLHNFRSHLDLEIEFTKGVNAVVGVNGAGKSSIIEAVIFLLFGEGFNTKQAMLNTDSLSGYVSGTLMLDDGKTVEIYRVIEDSKVKMTYDGKTYVKAGEVKQLWQQLFQLDSHIFKHVNVAKQGEIPLLFSGTESVRREAFQKIFSVPNTTPLRNMIWNEYLKKAPPEYVTLSGLEEEQLVARVDECEKTIAKTNSTISNIALFDMLPEVEITQLYQAKAAAQTAITNRENSTRLKALLLQNETSRETRVQTRTDVRTALAGYPPEQELRDLDAQLTADENRFKQNAAAKTKRDILAKSILSVEEIDNLKLRLAAHKQTCDNATIKVAEATARINEADVKLQKLSVFSGKAECPTCGGDVKNLALLQAEIQSDKAKAQEYKTDMSPQLETARQFVAQHEATLAKANTDQALYDQANTQVDDTVSYDEATHKEIKAAIKTVKEHNDSLVVLDREIAKMDADIEKIKTQLDGFGVFDSSKYATPEAQIAAVDEKLSAHIQAQADTAKLKLEIQKLQLEQEGTLRRIEQSEANKQLNAKRTMYVESLQEIYDVLHPSQFAANLIQTYASVLESKLAHYLKHFGFPYTVKVTDEFNFEVSNDQGHKLPDVSGGQSMMLGLSIRLALHQLFGQSFQLLAIDEPSQGLDAANQIKLWELIDSLRTSKIVEQIIIIDHKDELRQVVDHTITV